MKPQLLFVTDHLPFPTDLDGSTVINGNLMPWLAEAFSIHYCCLENPHIDDSAIRETRRHVESLHVARPDKSSGPMLGLAKLGRFLLGRPHETEPVASRELRQIVSDLQRDNDIACAWIDLHYHAYLIEQLKEIPAIASPHDARPLLYETFAASSGNPVAALYYRLHAEVLRRYEQRYFSRFNRILYVSGKDADYASAYLPADRIAVIPNGFDTRRMKTPTDITDRSAPRLVFSGNLDYKPNRDAAIFLCRNFMPAVLDSFPQAQLTIVGKANERWVGFQSEAIHFTGHVPDIVEELSRHDVYICPLASGAGFKNKILDAVAAGLPVIGTPISFDGMAFCEGSDVLTSDIDTLGSALTRLLESDASTQMVVHAQDTLRKHYSWESVAGIYIDTVNAVITGRLS